MMLMAGAPCLRKGAAFRQPCLRKPVLHKVLFASGGRSTIAGKGRRTPMDARSSRYPDVYARWQRDPEGFWGEAANAIDWIEKPKKVFDKSARPLRPLVHRRRGQHLLQRARPPHRHPQQPAGADLRFPRHQQQTNLHLRPPAVRGAIARRHAARLRREKRRRRHPLYADGAGGDLRHAGLRAHRRHPLGGVRRLRAQGARHPHRRLPSRKSSCRRAAASRSTASCPTSRCSTRRSSSPSTSRKPA